MTLLWLSRARLRQDAGLTALAPVLLPTDDDARTSMAHRLIWTLFADSPDRARDFLYREDAPGAFMILSARAPAPASALFHIDCKPFAPALQPDDRLRFRLRANPTAARSVAEGRSRRDDVVMRALNAIAKKAGETNRAEIRAGIVQQEGAAWLHGLGERHGFCVLDVLANGYQQLSIPRSPGRPIRLSVMELQGVLSVTDPAAFLARVAAGFGRGRAFGCGLMLIRRA